MNSTYTGTMLPDLIALADEVVRESQRLRAERDKRLCDHCCKPYSTHTHLDYCEWPTASGKHTQFREMFCQAGDGRGPDVVECGRVCIPGTEYCKIHEVEMDS